MENTYEFLLKIGKVFKDIKNCDDIKKKKLFYKSMIVNTHNYDLLTSKYPNNMRKNFWHRQSDYVTFQQDKDIPI